MKSHKTKAKAFFNKHSLSYEARADLEKLLLKHERDTKNIAISFLQDMESNLSVKGEGSYVSRDVAIQNIESLEVKG